MHVDDFRSADGSNDAREANALAREWLLPGRELDAFCAQHPRVSRHAVLAFAEAQGRHPAIVVGQLQHRGVVPYTHFRELLPRVSDCLGAWLSP